MWSLLLFYNMKKILAIAFISTITIIGHSQTSWLVKKQIAFDKTDSTKAIQVEYTSKNITLRDCNGFPSNEYMTSLFTEYDYNKNIINNYDIYLGKDTCYISEDNSKILKRKLDLINEYKIIANYKCQKGIFHKNVADKTRDLIIWFTTDSALKDFFDDKRVNIEGVVLESENFVGIHTTTELSIIKTEPEILKIMRSLKPCDLRVPQGM